MVMEMVDSPLAPVRRGVRRDALPEEIQYRDDGCDIHSQCLTCPLPRCRYDEPGGVRAMLNSYRDRQILALRAGGAAGGQETDRHSPSRPAGLPHPVSPPRGGRKRAPAVIAGKDERRRTMREFLGAAVQTVGYVLVTSAAVWLVFQYVPTP